MPTQSSKEMTLEEELRSLSQGMIDEGVITPSDKRLEFIN